MFYFLVYFLGLVLTAILTWGIKRLAGHYQIVDKPDVSRVGRKIHEVPVPLLGGLAIFLAYFILLFFWSDYFLAGDLQWFHLIGFFSGALIIIIGGSLDDKYNLTAGRQIIFPILAVLAVIVGGVEIEKLTNPFGGFIYFSPVLSATLIIVWLLGMMYTTKLLDGIDGLVSGIGVIGALIIFLFTITTRYYQPDIALAAVLLAGTVSGFLFFNWHPAKIFLGEGGSLLLGYILGVLSIISGAKIAIALLIMGIPALDVAWTIVRRLIKGKNPFKFADREHLHHRLLAAGLSQRQVALVFYGLTAVFGCSSLFLQSRGKFWILILLLLVMLGLVISLRPKKD